MDLLNLRKLIELAATARDAAALRRAQAQGLLAQARDQLDTLHGYAQDYEARAQRMLAAGCDIAAQSNLRAFTAKLRRAVEQQRGEVARREQVVAAAAAEFLQMQRKLKSLEALAERRLDGERRSAARREQKTMDELARATRPTPLAGSGW